MKKILRYTMLLAVLLGLVGCAYFPRLTGIPLIKEKGDTRIEAGGTFMGPNVRASVSHGVTDKIAVQVAVNTNNFGIKKINELTIGDGYNYYGQGAVGYYKKINDRHVVELYAGFGYGRGNFDGNVTDNYQNGNYQMYFTQINFGGIKPKRDHLEAGVGLKLGYIYTNMNFNTDIFHGIIHQTGIVVEPTGFVRLGGPKWKFHAALGFGKWFQISDNTGIHWFPVNLGIGVSYSFGGS